ncbi:MAG: transcriptional regulator BetI [Siculibacillus sp.]|nr:transcriptional regulator BetI [Siculibacillus sp.]
MSLAPSGPVRPRRHAAEDVRRRQLIEATIEAIAAVGFQATTLAEIAGRAGVSPGLVAFYFRDKNGLLEATLRHLAVQLSQGLSALQRRAPTSRARIRAVVDATLGPVQFDRRIASVWLAFWAQVPVVPRFARIQRIYERRLLSNLRAGFRAHPTVARLGGDEATRLAEATAAMIDGAWLRATLSPDAGDGARARAQVCAFVDDRLALLDLALLGGRRGDAPDTSGLST